MVTQRLLRPMLFQKSPTPSLRWPQVRKGSPAPGCSTLMTSAPNSPMAVATRGPAASVAASTTRIPSSGGGGSGTVHRGRTGQSERVAQGPTGVAVTEHPASLELRDHQPD